MPSNRPELIGLNLRIPHNIIPNKGPSRRIHADLLVPSVAELGDPLQRRSRLLWLLSHGSAEPRFGANSCQNFIDNNIQEPRKRGPNLRGGFCSLVAWTPPIKASPPSRSSAKTTFRCQISQTDASTMEASLQHLALSLFVVGGGLQIVLCSTQPRGDGREGFLAICSNTMLLVW